MLLAIRVFEFYREIGAVPVWSCMRHLSIANCGWHLPSCPQDARLRILAAALPGAITLRQHQIKRAAALSSAFT